MNKTFGPEIKVCVYTHSNIAFFRNYGYAKLSQVSRKCLEAIHNELFCHEEDRLVIVHFCNLTDSNSVYVFFLLPKLLVC